MERILLLCSWRSAISETIQPIYGGLNDQVLRQRAGELRWLLILSHSKMSSLNAIFVCLKVMNTMVLANRRKKGLQMSNRTSHPVTRLQTEVVLQT